MTETSKRLCLLGVTYNLDNVIFSDKIKMPIIIEKYILTDNLHNITLTHIK